MNKKYQVFISSTFTDLKEERRKAIEIILKADCIPAGMESFVAIDDEQFNVIKKVIDLCDYYLLIIGKRYGSINPVTNKSYTEMEYDYALSRNMTVLVFALDESVPVDTDKEESDPKSIESLRTFRTKALTNRMASIWKNSEELCTNIALSISKTMHEYPAIGWVRSDQIDTIQSNEIEELESKVLSLQQELLSYKTNKVTLPIFGTEATSILLEASTPQANGQLIVSKTLDGTHFSTATKTFCSTSNNKEISIWENAINQLENQNYIKSANSKREIFIVTDDGYKYADNLRKTLNITSEDKSLKNTDQLLLNYISEHDYFTISDISSVLGITLSSARRRLNNLKEKDYILEQSKGRASIWKLNIPYIKGSFSFDYSNNNGTYVIGEGAWCFSTKWSKGSNSVIHAYSDSADIESIAKIKYVSDINALTKNQLLEADYSSRCRDISIGDVAIWKNKFNHYLVTLVRTIHDDTRGHESDLLECEYRIIL